MEHVFYILIYNTYLTYIFPFYLIAAGGREGVSPIASYNIKESVVFGVRKHGLCPWGGSPGLSQELCLPVSSSINLRRHLPHAIIMWVEMDISDSEMVLFCDVLLIL